MPGILDCIIGGLGLERVEGFVIGFVIEGMAVGGGDGAADGRDDIIGRRAEAD